MGGGRKMSLRIPYRAALAKRLRYRPDIYARYGGDDGSSTRPSSLPQAGTHSHGRSLPLIPANHRPAARRIGRSMPCAQGHDIDQSSRSRGMFRPRFANSLALSPNRGRRESRVPTAPAVSCAKSCAFGAHEHTGSAETSRPSPRNGFTAYFVLSPVSGLFCHRHLRIAPQAWRQHRGARTTRLRRTPRSIRPRLRA